MIRPDLPIREGERPRGIRGLHELTGAARALCLDFLVPPEVRTHYRLPAVGPWGTDSGSFRCVPLPDPRTLRVEVWPRPSAEDPALVVELTDTYLGHLEASWIVLNDVDGPRFHVDRDPRGSPIPLGSSDRNIAEELRALEAGLAPNQVRPGLRLFAPLIGRIEGLAAFLGAETLYVSPLAYHNAIKYEDYGFTYASDQDEVEWIHREFGRGGVLRRRMDGSRPFRMPWMAATVRGRSWAIRDEVMGRRWIAPQMYKFVGKSFSTCTFPGARW